MRVDPVGRASELLKYGMLAMAATVAAWAVIDARHTNRVPVDRPEDDAAIIATLHGRGHPLDEGSARALMMQDGQGMTCGPDNPIRIVRESNGALTYHTPGGHQGNVPDGVNLMEFCAGMAGDW